MILDTHVMDMLTPLSTIVHLYLTRLEYQSLP